MSADNDTTDEEIERIGDEPIDGDGTYPFAGLTRFDEGDAMTLPENVWTQQSSMRYWAQNKTSHFASDDEDTGAVRDLDPEVLPERGLSTMIDDLPRATAADVAVIHPRSGEVLRTLKSKAVVNPARMEEIEWGFGNAAEAASSMFTEVDEDEVKASIQDRYAGNSDNPVRDGLKDHLTEPQIEEVLSTTTMDDALYNIPTASYTIINPSSFLRPLCQELRDREWGDRVFGEVRLKRGGGRATLDLYVDGNHVESPVFADDREPVVVGLEVNWDFFGDWAVRCCGQALDWRCDNHISRLTDREIVKHAGDVESRTDWRNWFADILDRLETKRDQLSRIIEQASEETLDFGDLPEDIEREFDDADAAPWTALYSYMGLPDYLAEHAGKRLRSEAQDPYEPNWWEIHSGATFAVTHHDRGDRDAGGSYEDHARVANDMLMNPASMQERVVENYEADRLDDEQDTLSGEGAGIAQIETAFEGVQEKKERYEEWEEDLRDMGVEL